MDQRRLLLRAVKSFHTFAWFTIEACMVYVLYTGVRGRADRKTGAAAVVVASETLIFAANGFHCPLTAVAQRLGDVQRLCNGHLSATLVRQEPARAYTSP